jgi:N-acetylglucosamine-6-phosphate deacetylase
MATETPASVIDLSDRGRLEAGRRADILLLDEDLAVRETIVGGVSCFRL